ncbi:hypothetical protein [Sessilibacter corallicola]|uniref:hypothetical protein n=1 Tax=Sessilibacter corallicola TaxID=2904075 RepID=UPI001E635AD5|nr:hypothetical protein [Sessilibacter corallicola]MCE2029372.1 hypothetical protein [Sessilibacter corallicola]
MNNIAFNVQINTLLKAKYSIFLAIFPIGFMFLSFFPTWLVAEYLGESFGIQEGVPVKDAEHGWLWLSLLLSAMVVLMLLGYVFGWLLNALLALIIFGWSFEKVFAVFLSSDVPSHWLKDGAAENHREAKQDKLKQWSKVREQGKFKYILKIGVMGWGSTMFIVMAILPALRSSEPIGFSLLWQAVLWVAAGGVFGALGWYFSEKQYFKHRD